MTDFVTLYHPDTGGLQKAPAELQEHWATLGWRPVPGDLNLADAGAVDEFLAAPPDAPEGPPAKSGTKADWVAYAVTQGADPAEAEALTRDQLAEAYALAEPTIPKEN